MSKMPPGRVAAIRRKAGKISNADKKSPGEFIFGPLKGVPAFSKRYSPYWKVPRGKRIIGN